MKRKTNKTITTNKPQLQFDPAKKHVLHVTGSARKAGILPQQFAPTIWQEIRMGSHKEAAPHITASLMGMSGVPAKRFHGIWLPTGNLEQLYAHQVAGALAEIRRVLHDNGVLLLTVFDIQKVAEFVAKGNLDGPLYHAPGGAVVTALDVLYGYGKELEAGNVSVNPNTAFTANTLSAKLATAGFDKIHVRRDGVLLWAIAYKIERVNSAAPQIQITGEDMNKIMRHRDELDKPTEIWTAPSPLFG